MLFHTCCTEFNISHSTCGYDKSHYERAKRYNACLIAIWATSKSIRITYFQSAIRPMRQIAWYEHASGYRACPYSVWQSSTKNHMVCGCYISVRLVDPAKCAKMFLFSKRRNRLKLSLLSAWVMLECIFLMQEIGLLNVKHILYYFNINFLLDEQIKVLEIKRKTF